MPFNKEEFALKFGLTAMQMYEELYKCASEAEKYYDEYWRMEHSRYYLRDYDEMYVYASDYKKSIMVRIPYVVQGDNPMLKFDMAERVKHTYELWDMGEECTDDDMTKEKETIKKTMSLESEIETLKNEKQGISEKYSKLEETIAEKDLNITNLSKELETLKAYKLEKEHAEIQEKANNLYSEYVEYISDEDKVEFNKILFNYSNFEDFESKVMKVVAPKIKAQVYALKQNVNLNHNDNSIDINLMPTGMDNIKDSKPKSSREFLKEYVQE